MEYDKQCDVLVRVLDEDWGHLAFKPSSVIKKSNGKFDQSVAFRLIANSSGIKIDEFICHETN